MRHLISRQPLTVASLIALAAIAFWYLLFLLFGDGPRMLGYVNAGGYWFGMLSLVLVVPLAMRRQWIGGAMAAGLGLTILMQGQAPVMGIGVAAPGTGFRLVTASLRNANKDMESAATRLWQERPDVLVVQEARIGRFQVELARASGLQWQQANHFNELIACRCRILASGTNEGILWADLALPGGTVRIFNVRAPKAYENTRVNRRYFAALAGLIRDSASAIAAGDYNSTPWNEGYGLVADVATDMWRQGGIGPGFTFPAGGRRSGRLIPVVRIDHVFASSGFMAQSAWVTQASKGADHYPIVVDFARVG